MLVICTRICHAPFFGVWQTHANQGIIKAPHPFGCEAHMLLMLFICNLLLISQHVHCNLLKLYSHCMKTVLFPTRFFYIFSLFFLCFFSVFILPCSPGILQRQIHLYGSSPGMTPYSQGKQDRKVSLPSSFSYTGY